jgi:DNA mismatch repair protein MutS2
VGGGTDPIEGGALGAAVLDHFRRRGALVIATTHDDALKSFAATTDGVTVAAFGFDADTFAPTFTLRYGAPGRSLALEVARRLGMRPEIVADAERRRSGRETLLATHLAQVDRDLAAADRERRLAREERAALASEREALLARESSLAEREALLRKRSDDRLAERLREARAEVDAVVARLKSRAETLADQAGARARSRAPVLSTGEVGGLRAEARAALERIEGDTIGQAGAGDPDEALDGPPAEGDRVWVAAVAAEGIVRGTGGRQIEVEVRGKRMRVALDGLRRAAPGGGPPARQSGSRATSRQATGITVPARAGAIAAPTKELVVIGATVDDALDRLEKFMDDALLADDRRLRVVHGHGTGRLRESIRAHLKKHPMVDGVSPGGANEGGDGATIVDLKD